MTRKLIKFTALLIITLSFSISITHAFVYEQQTQNLTQTIKNTKLWIDSFDLTRDQWSKQGASPYLDAQDEPRNYVFGRPNGLGSQGGDQIGDFGFENHSGAVTINSVILRVYGRASPSFPDLKYFSVYLWNGSSWYRVMDFKGEKAYVWKEVNVSLYLDTWDKINRAKIYLETEAEGQKGARQACDAALLVVDYE